MTRSPFLTVRGMRSPVSVLRAPSPTASMVPVLGLSLLVSGRKMPEAVLVSASSRLTRILSWRGRTLVLVLLAMRSTPETGTLGRHAGTEARRHGRRAGSLGVLRVIRGTGAPDW